MNYEEKTLQKNYVYKGKILTLRDDEVVLPNGTMAHREIIEHSGGACVLYVEDEKILFVKQYRYAYGEIMYEIPAGKLDKGEEPIKAAARELEEEAGLKAGSLELLHVNYPTPGYTNEKIYIYRAYDCTKTAAHLDEDEFLETEYIPVEQVKKMLKDGEIRDGKTVIAIQAYLLSLYKD